ncbi:MAG: HAD hydrolase family protein [Mycoplasmoidaceae bacterium]
MGKIKWILMNIDNTQIDTKENKIIQNGEMRRTINFLLDKKVHFTLVTKFHSSIISKLGRDILIPNKDTFIIASYGTEIYSYKKKKVVKRALIEKNNFKDLEKVIKRIDFDFCKKIFVVATEKNGFTFIWNNNYKYFKSKVDEFEKNNSALAYEVIDSITKNGEFLNVVVTFFEDTDLKKLISLLDGLFPSLSYKMIQKDKLLIASKEAGVESCMEVINSNKNYRFPREAIMTLSDSLLDINLFKLSDVAITVDGAPDELKKAATNVFVGVENMFITEFLKKEIAD